EVFVTTVLPKEFDWDTFELGEICIGNQIFDKMVGESDGIWTMAQSSTGDQIQISAEVDYETGTVKWYLRSWVESTADHFPSDAYTGFLPPNNKELHDGEGYVAFKIRQKVGLESETVIESKATIIFDTNEPIETNVWKNTIDALIPTVTITEAAAGTNGSVALVWSGDDAHSGIAYYELYISRDGGELELVQGDLTGTSFEYTDSKGGSKCLFKIVAVDNVGLRAESTAEVTLCYKNETPSLQISSTSTDSITVNIGNVANASSYTLQYSTNSNFNSNVQTLPNISAGNHTITNLNANTKYYFRVMANGSENYSDSEWSTSESATTDESKLFAGYNEAECLQIQSFLEQTDANGVKNGTKLNSAYDAGNTATWSGITWNEIDGVKRISKIYWSNSYDTPATEKLVGTLDLSSCEKLTYLYCSDNALTSLEVSKNTALTRLDCSNNNLTSLDVSKNISLTNLNCMNNNLTSLDVSKNTALQYLYCTGCNFTALDVSKNISLTYLYCACCNFTALDVSKNISLTYLDCRYNNLTSLDVSGCTMLKALDCFGNQLTSLDVSKNTALMRLACDDNDLTSLDVSKNTALTGLSCIDNNLTSLDVSKNTALKDLECSYNNLTSLDLSKNTALTHLNCSSNNLTSLDVSKNTALTWLDCGSNRKLDYIRVSPNAIGTLEINAGSKWTFTNETGKQLGNGIWRLSTLPVTAASPDGSQSIYISSEPIVQLAVPSLNASDAGTSYVTVKIGNAANASGYTLQYSTNSSFTNAQTKTFPASGEHTISGLMANTNYFFRVKANGSGSHTDSEWTEMQLWTKKPLEKEAGSLIVNTTMDVVDAYDGVTSIREAISFAKEGETVTFDESMRDQTIVLNGTQLSLTKAVSLDAGDLNVTLDGDGKSGVIYIDTYSKTAHYLKGLTFTNSGDYNNGIEHRRGILTVTDCVIQDNKRNGISSGDTLTVENSVIARNEWSGIQHSGQKLYVSNSVIAGNGSAGISSQIANNALTLTNSTVVGNNWYGVITYKCSCTINNSIVTANLATSDINGKAKVTNSIVGSNDPANRDTLKNTQTGVRDPGFVNLPDFANYEEWLNAREEDWDLTLKAGSRAINAGDVKLFTKSGMPQTSSDLAGNARISGSKVDIGAYEYQSAFIETPDVEVVKSGKTLTVTWDAVYGASSYLVEYRDVKTAKWTAKTVKKGTSLAINGKVGTTYEIRVAAVTANGNSKAAVETVTVYAPLTTPKLKALKDFCKDDTFAVEVTNYAANLASAAESVTFGMNGIYETFTIENGSGNVSFASGEVVTFQNGTFTVTNAKANSQYKLEVMFSNPLTGSAFAKANVKTTKTTYLAPTNFCVTASTSNSITLDWSDSPAKTDASKYAEKYTVQYSTNGGKSWRSVSVKTSEATLTRLKSGTYLIRVLAAKDSKFEASLPTEILEFRL
ncbi:MAG: leucine-rich repeat domain-containing protein, partial [Thermoguttaceae bacterium]|nr:leucine-rich repeat domain-containing protein [Thermoguttaceae bacterium]